MTAHETARTMRQALERLATPHAFSVGGVATPEAQARMVYAQAVLEGDPLPVAERKAVERAVAAHQKLIERSLKS